MSDKKIIPVKLTPIIQKAINVASEKHLGQKRKTDELPYIVHPFAVAWILSNYTEDEDIIAASLLHDTLEDVAGYRFHDIKKDFIERVANNVKEVSEDKYPNIITDETSRVVLHRNRRSQMNKITTENIVKLK